MILCTSTTSEQRSIMTQADILIVDDDDHLREVVRYALSREGFDVRQAEDGEAALKLVDRLRPDLIVLDVMMPNMDGLAFCRTLRSNVDAAVAAIPVVFLSSKDEELDKVLGLELGGDDYLTKPFSTRELVSRVKAVLRRTQSKPNTDPPKTLNAAGVTLDLDAHRAWVREAEVHLTATEFRIVEVLLSRPGRLYTRDELLERAYDQGHHVSDRTLDSHVRRIRQKLSDCGINPIETVHGLGYRLLSS